MKKILHFLWNFLEVIIIVYAIVITSFILCRNKYGYTQFGDYTFSKISNFDTRNIKDTKNGDLLVVKNSNDIKVGDIIYYYTVFDERYILRSDAVIDIKEDDYSALYTLNDSDKTSVSSNRVLGKYANTYNGVGKVLEVLESKIGFLFLVLLPIMIVFIYQLYEFIIVIRYERVEDDVDSEKKKKTRSNKNNQTNKKENVEILDLDKSSQEKEDIEIL